MLPEYDYKSLYPYTKTISSSQFLCYETDPEKFYIENVLGVRREATTAMTIGRIFSAAYADRNLDYRKFLGDLGVKQGFIDLFGQALSRFPVQKKGHPELPLICEFKGWKFRATLDDYVKDTVTIIENKTGQSVWTQERANYDNQLTFQAWVHWKLHGVPPRKILLNYWNTKSKHVDIRPFKTSRSIANLRQFEKRVEAVIEHLEAGNFSNRIY